MSVCVRVVCTLGVCHLGCVDLVIVIVEHLNRRWNVGLHITPLGQSESKVTQVGRRDVHPNQSMVHLHNRKE